MATLIQYGNCQLPLPNGTAVTNANVADAIQAALKLTSDESERERATLRAYVEREHALSAIISNMFEAIYPRTTSTRSIGV